MRKKAILLVAVSAICAFAKKDYDEAVEPFRNFPGSVLTEAAWIEPHDETYLPYNMCSEVQGLDFVKLEEQVKYYYDHKDGWTDLLHYHALVSIVRVTYRVTCLNKLQYEGVYHLFSEPRKIDGSSFQNSGVVKRFKAHAHGWEERPLDYLGTDGVYYAKETEYRFEDYTVLDWAKLKETWKMQKVSYPEWKYAGIPGKKLARPVLFVHGLNSDFEVWGVEALDSTKNKASTSFQWGLVKRYKNGSAPDILARTQNIDNSEENINHNGIYFFQAYGHDSSGTWIEGTPLWNDNHSQAKKLNWKLEQVLDDFCEGTGIDWRATPELEVDIVAHSQGGLVVRELLRALRNMGDLPGSEVAANHIGRLITVDSPHFGSELAANAASIEDKLFGIRTIVGDLDSLDADSTHKHTLVNAKLDMAWYEYASTFSSMSAEMYDDFAGWDSPGVFLRLFSPAIPVLGYVFGAASAWATDISLKVTGPYLGKYKAKIFVDIPGPKNHEMSMKIDALDTLSREVRKLRRRASYLSPNSGFLEGLETGFDGGAYPLKPNGEKLTLLPLYSSSTSRFLAEMVHSVAEDANRICSERDEGFGCLAVALYFEKMALKMAAKKGFTLEDVRDVNFNDDLLEALVNIQDAWFSSGDAVVSEYSQKFVNEEMGLSFENEIYRPYFKQPRNYLFHDALAPWEDVLHASFGNFSAASAPLQGFDIACALDFYCDDILGDADSKIILLDRGEVSLSGDFRMSPVFLKRGVQSVQVEGEGLHLEARYEPESGASVIYVDGDGAEVRDSVLYSGIAVSPSVSRRGDTLEVSFNNYSGKRFVQRYAFKKIPETVTYRIVASDGESPKAIAGVANVANPSSQTPPNPPQSSIHARSSVFAYHREARDTSEWNASRPRILVANASNEDVCGFKVAYYFTADSARNPQVEVDYPKIPATLENLGGDQWRFVLDASDSVLKAGDVFPNLDGWQIRLHYADWAKFKHLDDWSANYNVGIPKVNRRIVVYDASGNVLWGEEPDAFKSLDEKSPASPKGILSWKDAASWEWNVFKPEVFIKNTGSVALKNYQAKLWFRVPEGKELYVPVDDWYTPVSKPSLENVGENVWALKFSFDRYILYPGDSVTEGNVGLHLADWSAFDKTVCGMALLDSTGDVIYGKEPSVPECRSYETSQPLTGFARREKR